MRFSVNSEFMIDAVEDGALVFDLSSGATTLICQSAFFVVDTVYRLGKVDRQDLEETCGTILADGSELSCILALLEKTRLIIRC